jgi:hypothetical protein
MPKCGSEVSKQHFLNLRTGAKTLRLQICGTAVAEQHFFKSCRFLKKIVIAEMWICSFGSNISLKNHRNAIAEVLPSSCGIATADI